MAAATWKTMNAPIHVKKKSSAKLRNANFISYFSFRPFEHSTRSARKVTDATRHIDAAAELPRIHAAIAGG